MRVILNEEGIEGIEKIVTEACKNPAEDSGILEDLDDLLDELKDEQKDIEYCQETLGSLSCKVPSELLEATPKEVRKFLENATPDNDLIVVTDLPDEVWLRVLGFLDQSELCTFSLVSKYFLRLCRDPSLWQTISLVGDAIAATEDVVGLIKRCKFLTEFSVQARDDSDVLLETLCASCPQLKCLDVKFCQCLTPGQLQQVSDHCLGLESLNLEGTGCLNNDGDSHEMEGSNTCHCSPSDSFSASLGRFSRLKELNLFLCKNLNSEGLDQIARGCDNLESLNIDEVNYLSDESMLSLIHHRRHTLRKLWLDGESLTDKSFSRLGDLGCLNLLSISFADFMQGPGLDSVSRLENLEWLRIRRGAELQPPDFVSAFGHGKLKKLTTLDLSECSNLSDQGLISVSENCPLLDTVSLCWCWELTDQGLLSLVTRCRSLVNINLCGVVRLSGTFLIDINKKLRALKVLDLEQVPDIDMDIVEDLVRQDFDLEIKDYYGELVQPGKIFSEILLYSEHTNETIKFIKFDHEDTDDEE